MELTVRKAEAGDFPKILQLYENARAFMAARGNPNQWGKDHPRESLLREDLAGGHLFVAENETGIHGVFMFRVFEDPTYGVIEEGTWHQKGPYGVIHRVAGDGSGGILKAAVAYGLQHASYLRMDTHRQNLPMQKALKNQGFTYCGIIYTEKGSPRLAYDRPETI